MEPRESSSSVVRGEIYIGGVRREAHAVGRWAGRTERALARRHDCLDTTEVSGMWWRQLAGGRGSVPSRMCSAEQATSR